MDSSTGSEPDPPHGGVARFFARGVRDRRRGADRRTYSGGKQANGDFACRAAAGLAPHAGAGAAGVERAEGGSFTGAGYTQTRSALECSSEEQIWDFYLELFGQRQSRFGEWLVSCDRIALDCYQGAYTGIGIAKSIPAPPPFSYMRTIKGAPRFDLKIALLFRDLCLKLGVCSSAKSWRFRDNHHLHSAC
jgi:hypothetical protein